MKGSLPHYKKLVQKIERLLDEGRDRAFRAVNSIMVRTYWELGRHIVEYEQKGNFKADYGTEIIDRLSTDLTKSHGKGFSRSNLFQVRAFYLRFPKLQAVSTKLTWSHYVEIIKADSDLESGFYAVQCLRERWTVRELKRQMQSLLFHRLARNLSQEQVLSLSEHGSQIHSAQDIVKDPYVLEFLNLPAHRPVLENDLEEMLIKNLEKFLLELGKGFTFVGRQYKLSIGSRHFFVDLVFYHRILKCFVLIDLKAGEIEHGDIGQMNLYLNYFAKEENSNDDSPPIGIVLGAIKDQILIEYATQNITNQLFVSKYQLYLPEKEKLESELYRLIA